MDNRKGAVASVGAEGELLIGVKSIRIHAFANGRRGNHFSAICIHHSHHLIATARKQSSVFLVHGQPARLFARGQRPAFYHRRFFSVDAGHFALVFDVYKNAALAVGDAKFRFAVERNSR